MKESRKVRTGWSWGNTPYPICLTTLLKADAIVFHLTYRCKGRMYMDRSNLKTFLLVLFGFLPARMWGSGKGWGKVAWIFFLVLNICPSLSEHPPWDSLFMFKYMVCSPSVLSVYILYFQTALACMTSSYTSCAPLDSFTPIILKSEKLKCMIKCPFLSGLTLINS